jgi:hypothetical protein
MQGLYMAVAHRLCCIDMPAMLVTAFRVVTIEDFATRAFHPDTARFPRFPFIWRKALALISKRIFPCRKIALVPPCLEISVGSLRKKNPPCFLEIGARPVERLGRSMSVLAWMAARIKAGIPFPRIGITRIAGAPANRADLHVAVIDVPAIGAFGIAAEGEGGHGPLNRRRGALAIALDVGTGGAT